MDIAQLITIKENFLVVLDSRNATNYYNGSLNSNVYFEFDEPVRIPKDCIKCYCSVFSFSSPNSLYTINSTNNLLSITFNGNVNNYTIPNGNYNANSFKSTLTGIIDSNFSISFSTITNTFTISHSLYSFTINSSSTCYEIMGFSNNTVYNSVNNSITLPYTCNFNGLNNLNIHLANLTNQNVDSFNKSSSSIVQSVPINSGSGQILYSKTNDFNFPITVDNIDYIQVLLQDDLENFLDFNNQHWNLTLYFTIVRDIDRFSHHNSFFNILQNGYS